MQLKSLIAVPLVVLALAGCSSQAQNLQPSETSVVQKPLFASDEEALAAAQTAYAHYLEVSDQIARDGGVNPERLKGLVSLALYEEQELGYLDVQQKSLKAVGSSSFDHFEFQSRSNSAIANYVCLRLSGISVIDVSGNDVTPLGRENNLPLILNWTVSGDQLTLEKSEVWSGENFCL